MHALDSVRTGDLILFSDSYWITSIITRLACQSVWTHLGIAVRLPKSLTPHRTDDNDVYIWEVSNSIFAFANHLSPTLDRQSTGVRLVSLKDKLSRFPKRGNRVCIMALTHSSIDRRHDPLLTTLWPVLVELHDVKFRHSLCAFIQAVYKSCRRPVRSIDELATIASRRVDLRMEWAELMDRFAAPKLFCSEAVALVLQRLGALDPAAKAKRFVPADFGPRFISRHRRRNCCVGMRQAPWINGWHLQPLLSLNLPTFSE